MIPKNALKKVGKKSEHLKVENFKRQNNQKMTETLNDAHEYI